MYLLSLYVLLVNFLQIACVAHFVCHTAVFATKCLLRLFRGPAGTKDLAAKIVVPNFFFFPNT